MSEKTEEQGLPSPDLLILDADSILYRICWKTTSPALAVKAMDDYVEAIIKATNVSEAYVFVKGKDNFRFSIDLEYKGHRVNSIDDAMKERIERLYEHCREVYIPCDGAEADDFCNIYFNKAVEQGHYPVLGHIDKDLNMIPGLHYNYVNQELYTVDPVSAHTFLMRQLLTGDSADNIKGLSGCGPAAASKVLEGYTNEQMFDRVLSVWKDFHEGTLSTKLIRPRKDVPKDPENWQAHFEKCANLIYIRQSEDDLRRLSTEEIRDRMAWVGDGPIYWPISNKEQALLEQNMKNVHDNS